MELYIEASADLFALAITGLQLASLEPEVQYERGHNCCYERGYKNSFNAEFHRENRPSWLKLGDSDSGQAVVEPMLDRSRALACVADHPLSPCVAL